MATRHAKGASTIITPTFRSAPYYSEPPCRSFQRPLRYIKYNKPTIEYDCTDRDYLFVDLMNQEICKLPTQGTTLDYRELERIIDTLENLAFNDGELFKVVKALRKKTQQLNDRCCVCVNIRNEPLIQCRSCKIFVHMSCYRSSDVTIDNEWLCDWCEYSAGHNEQPPKCALCSHSGGALKRTDQFELWCHVVCFENHPSTNFDPVSLVVTGLESSPLPSWFTHCSVCETLSGSPIQCMEDSCTTPIHLHCSHKQIQHLYSPGLEDDSPLKEIFFLTCTKHTWMKWIQTRLTTRCSILSEDHIDLINEQILLRGGDTEISDPILSLLFEYWLLVLNPSFPDKYLLPSLSVAKNMKIMEQRWLTLEV